MKKMLELDKAKFWSYVDRTNYCWNWKGSLSSCGYGVTKHGKERSAHRIAYQLIYGTIPKNKSVCHHCDNRKCVNPTHLFIGSHFDNMFDRQIKGQNRRLGKSSKYKGVSWRQDSKRWRVWVRYKRKTVHVGCFLCEKEAARAFDKKCYELFKRKEMLNFPDEIQPPEAE